MHKKPTITLTDKIIKVPYRVQDTIPIYRIARDGIFELENKKGDHTFDKMYLFEDINFSSQDEIEKDTTFRKYKELLNTFRMPYKIIIANHYINNEHLKKNILRRATSKLYEPLATAYNDLLKSRVELGNGSITQSRYIVVNAKEKTFADARLAFTDLEKKLDTLFTGLGSALIPMDANERLFALHSFYRMGEEEKYYFNWENYTDLGRDFRNDIINTCIKEHKSYLEFEGEDVARTIFARNFEHSVDDDFVSTLTSQPFPLIFTMTIDPISTEEARKMVMDKYMANERSINKEQEFKNKRGDFSSEIAYNKRKQQEATEDLLNGISSFDEKMSNVAITLLFRADSLTNLDRYTKKLVTDAGKSLDLATLSYKQLDAMNTTLPTGTRHIDNSRTLVSESLSAFTPFSTQELSQHGANCYGFNQVSKNLILCDRKALTNGNGMYFGLSGSGKSVSSKNEMAQVLAFSDDDVIVIDPMSEYRGIAEEWHGNYINLSKSDDECFHVNPLHIPEEIDEKDITAFIAEKCEFAYAICEQATLPNHINKHHLGIIDNALRELYQETFGKMFAGKRRKRILSPTLRDLRRKIHEMYPEDPDATALYDNLEVFTDGTLDIFAEQQTESSNNRFTVYSFGDIGNQMRPMAMLVMIESITSKIKYNQRHGRATWVYVDEIHELWGEAHSLNSIERMWREVRKRGGICTGMSQNLNDALQNRATKTIISNSKFILLLDQGPADLNVLTELFDVSATQIAKVKDAPQGTGLIKFDDTIVAFDNTLPKESGLYQLFNTNFHEMRGEY